MAGKINRRNWGKKQWEEKVPLLAAALRGPGPFFPRGRDQGQGHGKPRGLFSPEISWADCCNCCRWLGHWEEDCPYKPCFSQAAQAMPGLTVTSEFNSPAPAQEHNGTQDWQLLGTCYAATTSNTHMILNTVNPQELQLTLQVCGAGKVTCAH